MKITKTRLKQIIKEELQLAIDEAKLVGDGTKPPRDFCVGYVKKDGGKRFYQTSRAGGPGPASTKVKTDEQIPDKFIKSTHEGKCDSEENKKRQARAKEEREKKQKELTKEDLDKYVQKKFSDKAPMEMEHFDAALEKFEMKTRLDYPDSVFALYDILDKIDPSLAIKLKNIYSDDFRARDEME